MLKTEYTLENNVLLLNDSTPVDIDQISLDLLKHKDLIASLAQNQTFVNALSKNKAFTRTFTMMYGYSLISPAKFEILKRMGAGYL